MNRSNERRRRKSQRAESENFEDDKNINDLLLLSSFNFEIVANQ